MEWNNHIQTMIQIIDASIIHKEDIHLTLETISKKLGYSSYYVSHKFKEISGMSFRDFYRFRKMAFVLNELKNSNKKLIEIALDYGFSSQEAFSRAFKEIYVTSPSEYRKHPQSVVLHTILRPFDCFLLEKGGSMTNNEIKTYFVNVPAHKYLHIRNYQSIGYYDFWQKQNLIPNCDYNTIQSIIHKIPDKLDEVIAYINEPEGRICSWGIPLAESYGIRVKTDYNGWIPDQMMMMDVDQSDYIVFEHGPFDIEKTQEVETKIEKAMKEFDYTKTNFELDLEQGKVFYFYFEPNRFFKYVRPVKRRIK
ncbi:helix-turn-helix transcriptional regulator [Floccifex sp.]|uniref:helix-turn-helix transcriptional regulator n=1 Tax=Floccifex sp. TaxID=2815810 RepID=UPI003EFF501F